MRDDKLPYWRQRGAVIGLAVAPGTSREALISPPRRAVRRPPRFFTVHLGFEAAGPSDARELAVG
ncbi:hypothetical protein [Micromonospora rhizosphaerae]|uniref:hypothetical protein n=1 Tax=Micromonospora rhizosphaerae TaxID=568872 RepID=UPI001FE0339E|nr:hypothetical protein [Micromonospora rhizosphaerae]